MDRAMEHARTPLDLKTYREEENLSGQPIFDCRPISGHVF